MIWDHLDGLADTKKAELEKDDFKQRASRAESRLESAEAEIERLEQDSKKTAVKVNSVESKLEAARPAPLKIRFETLLGEINPRIIAEKRPKFSVLVDESHLQPLRAMIRENGFLEIASVQFTGANASASSGASFGQNYTDLSNTGSQSMVIITRKLTD